MDFSQLTKPSAEEQIWTFFLNNWIKMLNQQSTAPGAGIWYLNNSGIYGINLNILEWHCLILFKNRPGLISRFRESSIKSKCFCNQNGIWTKLIIPERIGISGIVQPNQNCSIESITFGWESNTRMFERGFLHTSCTGGLEIQKCSTKSKRSINNQLFPAGTTENMVLY